MKIIELTNKEDLDDLVSFQKHSQFLQSFEWGEFQKKFGNKVIRLGITNPSANSPQDGGQAGQVKFAIQLIKKSLPLGKAYFYAPRIGVKDFDEKELKFLFDEIKKISKNENVIFLRFEPKSQILYRKSLILKTIDVQASQTLILNIDSSEEELLKSMHQKTRYNIRLAEKKGVVVREGSAKDFEDFWKIMEETSARDKFRLHSKKYYQEMISLKNVKLLVAEYDPSTSSLQKGEQAGQGNKIIAGVILSFFGDMGSYVHGASSNEYRNVMAPYILQWEGIKLSQKKGCKYYDFNGIDEKKWPGVTRFKMGFGGEIVEYPGAFDLVFNNIWYNIYKLIRKVRRLF